MNHLHRELAPITEAGWSAIEEEAKQRLTTWLAARQVVDVSGPKGWDFSATNVGRVSALAGSETVETRQRQVLPVVELRAPFDVARDELEAIGRGALALDLGSLDEAARQIALAENGAVFEGLPSAGIVGVREAASHPGVQLSADFNEYPTSVAMAITALEQAGVGGPYGLAIGPAGYTGIIETAEHGGYPLREHLRQILGGPIVWSPGLAGGLVVSLRGGDLLFELGQDISIGYLSHDADSVRLYFEESFTFRVVEPDAAIALLGSPAG
jgi:uncharacterized linocin/CFP29 family protein